MATSTFAVNMNGVTEHYSSSGWSSQYTFQVPGELSTLPTACLITKMTLKVECATNLNKAPPLRYTLTYPDGAIENQSITFPQDHASTVSTAHTVSLTGQNYFGNNIPQSGFCISLSVDGSIMSWYKWWINKIELEITYTIRSTISFTGVGVTNTSSIVVSGQTPTAPSVSMQTGYTFLGWKSSLNNTTYTTIPTAGEVDVTYTAQWTPITYRINVSAVDATGSAISTAGISGVQSSYTIGSNISFAANTSDLKPDTSHTYVFQYWTFSSGTSDNIVSWNSNTTGAVNIGTLNVTEIDRFFANNTTLTATAHYIQVYDFSVRFANTSANYVGGVKNIHIGYNENGSEKGIIYPASTISSGNAKIRATTPSCSVHIYLNNTGSQDDYTLNSRTATNATLTTLTDNTNPAPSSSFVSQPLNYTVTMNSSTSSLSIEVVKNYFAISLAYSGAATGDVTDGIIKVYRNGTTLLQLSAFSRIPRDSTIKIDGSAAATATTKYNVSSLSAPSGITVNSDKTATFTPTTITSGKETYAFSATLSKATCSITTTVTKDGSSTTTTATVDRTSSYTFTQSAIGGYMIQNAYLRSNNQVIYTWSNQPSLNYTVANVLNNMVLQVEWANNPAAYVYLEIEDCEYGYVPLTSPSALRSSYTTNPLRYPGVQVDRDYELTRITYQWYADDVAVTDAAAHGEITVAQSEAALINAMEVPGKSLITNNVIPTNQIATCKMQFSFRKNMLYYQKKVNNVFRSVRPSDIYVHGKRNGERVRQQVIAVYGQTSDHHAPILLYGDPRLNIPTTTQKCGENVWWAYSENDGALNITGTGAMYNYANDTRPWANICTNIQHVFVGAGVTEIGDYAIQSCSNLSRIELPPGLVRLRHGAVQRCGALHKITLPKSLISIGDYAFYQDAVLESITIPIQVGSVGSYAFSECSDLQSVAFDGTPNSIGSNAFLSCTSLTDIYVPWARGAVAGAPWGAPTNATIHYNYVG